MAINRDPLSVAEINRLFRAESFPAPPAGTFELALVLGGTASAGAYTAGVLDFLFEALDCWTRRRDADDPAAPRHRLILKLIAGTSGGGVNAGIAARALAYQFNPVTRSTQIPATGSGNPFYDVWVKKVSLDGLLGTRDLGDGPVLSLLDGSVIDDLAGFIAHFSPGPAGKRGYLADPLRLILTLTNMRGIPYRTQLGGEGAPLSETFVDHADFARFAVAYPGSAFAEPRPDEFVLGFDGEGARQQQISWDTFGGFAKGTSAFPVGLPPRDLERPLSHYRYRVAALPDRDAPNGIEIVPLVPDWDSLLSPHGSDEYRFYVVDGGATDNEPIELARTALAGVDGRNPRDGMVAQRGVMLVDPFAGVASLGGERAGGLLQGLGDLAGAMMEQNYYDTSDILLALDERVFSRFLIEARSPSVRGDLRGDMALATAGLQAFMGFACEDFRRHDFLLGRANCQKYLREEFVLPVGAQAFGDGWQGIDTGPHEIPAEPPPPPSPQPPFSAYLPIIPLFDSASATQETEDWPVGKLDPDRYRDGIEARFQALVAKIDIGGMLGGSLKWAVEHFGAGPLADAARHQIETELKKWGLLPP